MFLFAPKIHTVSLYQLLVPGVAFKCKDVDEGGYPYAMLRSYVVAHIDWAVIEGSRSVSQGCTEVMVKKHTWSSLGAIRHLKAEGNKG